MNLVPSRETSTLVKRAAKHAARTSGADAAALYLPQVKPDQAAAFVAAVLELTVAASKPSQAEQARIRGERRRLRMEREEAAYTAEEARRAHALYSGGTRNTWAITGERVYQRRQQRARRERRALARRDDAVLLPIGGAA